MLNMNHFHFSLINGLFLSVDKLCVGEIAEHADMA